MDTIILRETVDSQTGETACDFLASRTGLSRGKVKDAMNKGAVWIGKGKGRLRRLRRATAAVNKGDRIEFYYDEKLLSLKPPEAVCLSDGGTTVSGTNRRGLWRKGRCTAITVHF